MYTFNLVKPHMDPARTLAPFFDDAFFRGMMGCAPAARSPMGFRVDIREKDDRFELAADLPGVEEEKLNVSVDHDQLIISAERERVFREEGEEKAHHVKHMERRFDLEGIDQENIEAVLKNGVLYLNLPKLKPQEAPAARKIEIRHA